MGFQDVSVRRLIVEAKDGLNSSEADKTIEVTIGKFGVDDTPGVCVTVGKCKNIYLDIDSLDELINMLQAVKAEV